MNKTALLLVDDYCVLDIETTGYSAKYGHIIEIGLVRVINNEIDSTYHSIVKHDWYNKYKDDEHVDYFKLITKASTIDAKPLTTVLLECSEFISDLPILGHNIMFDINFIQSFDSNFKKNNVLIDTLRIAQYSNQNFENRKLSTLKEFYNIQSQSHRALDDCITTHLIYQNLKAEGITFTRANRSVKYDFSQIAKTTFDTIDESNPFFEKRIVMSGKFKKTKKELAQILVNLGARIENELSIYCDILIVGDLKYQIEKFGSFSSKHKKAIALQQAGNDILIIDESSLYHLINI